MLPPAPRFSALTIELFERDVRLRLPFRFGIVTLRSAPQAFVRARIRLADGRTATGAAAELLVPKWFDKNPALSHADNFNQLRRSLALAREARLSGSSNTAFGHFAASVDDHLRACAAQRLCPLVAHFGPALIDRALLDALCRAHGASFADAVTRGLTGLGEDAGQITRLAPDLASADPRSLLAGLRMQDSIAARHTVGLLDPISAADLAESPEDGLPATLEEVVARYGHRWFKLKVAGRTDQDIERLTAIAAVLDRIDEPYRVTLDGNEQYDEIDQVIGLWRAIGNEPRLARLAASIAFVEQPLRRDRALDVDIGALAAIRPVIIDESDDTLDAFPRALALGYAGVSSKACKGIWRSLLNRLRCEHRPAPPGGERCFMSGEDLTVQAGLALQQDLALASLLGLEHVERNGHHYVNGMAALPPAEQQRFLHAHPDLYEHSNGATRVTIRDGRINMRSLRCMGFASAALPDWGSMRPMPDEWPGARMTEGDRPD